YRFRQDILDALQSSTQKARPDGSRRNFGRGRKCAWPTSHHAIRSCRLPGPKRLSVAAAREPDLFPPDAGGLQLYLGRGEARLLMGGRRPMDRLLRIAFEKLIRVGNLQVSTAGG